MARRKWESGRNAGRSVIPLIHDGWHPRVRPEVGESAALIRPPADVERIVTEVLVLERYRATHAPMVWHAIEESRAMLRPWVPEIAGLGDIEQQVSTGFAGLEHAWENRRKMIFAILAARDGLFLGEVGLYAIDWNRSQATVGIWLRANAERRGHATLALTTLAHYAHEQLRLSILHARVHPANVRSIRLMERIGFCPDGRSPAIRAAEGDTAEVLIYKRLLPAPYGH